MLGSLGITVELVKSPAFRVILGRDPNPLGLELGSELEVKSTLVSPSGNEHSKGKVGKIFIQTLNQKNIEGKHNSISPEKGNLKQ